MRKIIKAKLLQGKNLNTKEIKFVREKLMINYRNNCGICRVNALISLGISIRKALNIAAEYLTESSPNHR